MADLISLTTIVPLLYDAIMVGLNYVGEKAAEKVADTALGPIAKKIQDKLGTALQRDDAKRKKAFQKSVKLVLEKFNATYGREPQAALAALLNGKSKESKAFVHEATKLYLFSKQPDFEKISQVYSLTTRSEAFLREHKPPSWNDFSEPLSVFFDDLKATLRDDPLFRPIFDSETLFDIERLFGAFVETALTPTAGIYVRPAEPTYDESNLEEYLEYVIREHQYIDPRGIPQVAAQVVLKLEEIYVALQADKQRSAYLDVDRRMFEQELEERTKGLKLTEEQRTELKYRIWAGRVGGPEAREKVELAGVVRHHSKVVMLGDPGAGKTTLLRYLALQCATALKQGRSMMPGLGPTRLPIYIRIARYSEARQKNSDLALEDYLPMYFEGHGVDGVAPLLADYLHQGKCMVLLDGLDEIVSQRDRAEITSAIQRFVRAFWKEPASIFTSGFTADKGSSVSRITEGSEREKATKLLVTIPLEEELAEQGNQFVITSRKAGYRIAPLSGEFQHYAIREMSMEQIERFLDKWCHAVERNLTPDDPKKAEEIAADEISRLMKAIEDNSGVRQMAANPLMLTILALIHRNMTELPQRRVELYDVATKTLLVKWNPRVRGVDVVIPEHEAMALLGPVAFWLHETSPSGLAYRTDVEMQMQKHLAIRKGHDPEHPPLDICQEVSDFLDKVREFSGIFVERGEGLYGFMHLTFEEYFAARWLVVNPNTALLDIRRHLHQPRWREPILLGIGYLSDRFFTDYPSSLVQSILEANSEYEDVLHRDKLFSAACIADCLYILESLQQKVISELVALYCDRKDRGRYKSLQQQIEAALVALRRGPSEPVLERELVRALKSPDAELRGHAMEIVEALGFATEGIVRTLLELRLRERGSADVESALDLLRGSNAKMIEALEPKHLLKATYQQDASFARVLDGMAHSSRFLAFSRVIYGLNRRDFEFSELERILGKVQREVESLVTIEESSSSYRDALSGFNRRLRSVRYDLRIALRESPSGPQEMNDSFWREIDVLLDAATSIGGPVYELLEPLRCMPEGASLIQYLRRDSPVSATILRVLQSLKRQNLAEYQPHEIDAALTRALLATLPTAEGKLYMDTARGLYVYQQEALVGSILDDLKSADPTKCARALSVCTNSWYEDNRPEPSTLVKAWQQCAQVDQERLLECVISAVGPHAVTLRLLFDLLEGSDAQLQARARSIIESMKTIEADSSVLALLAKELQATEEVRRRHALMILSKVRGKKGLEIQGSSLLAWLKDDQQEVPLFAAFVLAETGYMTSDVIRLLVEGLKDRSDEIRTRAAAIVDPEREITLADFELALWFTLYDENPQALSVRDEIADRLRRFKHSDVQLTASWFIDIESDDETRSQFGSRAIGSIQKATQEVVHLLCEQSRGGSKKAQIAALRALWELKVGTREVIEVLIELLTSDDESLRGHACGTLGRLNSSVSKVANALLNALKDSSSEVRSKAAWFLGKIYTRIASTATKDYSKEGIRSQLYIALPSEQDSCLNRAFDEPLFQDAADAEAALSLLQNLETIDIDSKIASVLSRSEKLPSLLLDLLDKVRDAPNSQVLLEQIFAALVELLTDESSDVAQAAAWAMARIKQNDPDLMQVLRQHLRNDHELLRAIWGSAGDSDDWGSYHEQAVKNVVALVELNPVLVDDLLSALQQEMDSQDGSWDDRRILMATLAALSEKMAPTLEAKISLNDLLKLLVAAARDPGSYNTRRWAIKALGNIRQATPEVLDVLFAACRDPSSSVYDQAVEAARKFRRIEPGVLELLFEALTDSSIKVCQNAANMLGELGTSQEELKETTAAALYQALKDPSSIRKNEASKPLYDYFYDALVKVVG
jgi:hypothetical protein